jgi:AcrR family transcriptional regulator
MKSTGNYVGATGIDRRVARTRHALQHAFLRLIVEKGYEAVSIQDICEAADVGRSTFYLHFKDKDDLKRSGLEHLRRALMEHREKGNASNRREALDFSLPMLQHARDHLHIYSALAGSSGGGIALETIRRILAEQLKDDPLVLAQPSAEEREFRIQFLLGAFMSVLTWWLDRGAVVEVVEIDQLFRRAVGFSD